MFLFFDLFLWLLAPWMELLQLVLLIILYRWWPWGLQSVISRMRAKSMWNFPCITWTSPSEVLLSGVPFRRQFALCWTLPRRQSAGRLGEGSNKNRIAAYKIKTYRSLQSNVVFTCFFRRGKTVKNWVSEGASLSLQSLPPAGKRFSYNVWRKVGHHQAEDQWKSEALLAHEVPSVPKSTLDVFLCYWVTTLLWLTKSRHQQANVSMIVNVYCAFQNQANGLLSQVLLGCSPHH